MKTKNLALTAMFAAITMVLAPLVITLPLTPIPFSLSLIPVFLSGALLSKSYACYAQLVYLLAGVIGLPVFSQFRSGVGTLLGPTGGFLIAYPVMAFVVALVLERQHRRGLAALLLSMLPALVICYLFGSVWFMFAGHVGFLKSLSATVTPFVVFDLAKLVFSAAAALALRSALTRAKLLPSA